MQMVTFFCFLSSMVTLSLGCNDGPRHDLGTAIIYEGQRHNIEFYLNGRLFMPALTLEPLDSLHIAVTKHETGGETSTDCESTDGVSTLSTADSAFSTSDVAEVSSIVVADLQSGSSDAAEPSGFRCVPIDKLYSDEMLAYSQVHGGSHYVSLLKYD